MYCALGSDGNFDSNCRKEHCALYDKEYERCCFLNIAKAFDYIINSNKIEVIKIKEK